MTLGTLIILANLLGFSMLFAVLLFRGRAPRVRTITRVVYRDKIIEARARRLD